MIARGFTQRRSVQRVKRYWLSVAFLLGFVIDNITLNRVDQVFDNIILATYVILAMVSLLILYAAVADRLPERIAPFARKYAPLLTQYAFGGLLSGMLIFYGRSGDWLESWPFMLIILVVIFGNEAIHNRAQRLIFNLAVLFIGLFSYVTLIVPVIIKDMGPLVFVWSGILALLIMYGFLRLLLLIIPNFLQLQMRNLVFTLGMVFTILNFLYFANIIPPIPLSLQEIGIYHSVVRFGDGRYQLTYEEPRWWQFWRNSDDSFHYQQGDNIFCFTSVFAPTRFETDIFHRWEYFDEAAGEWTEHARLSYPISGGSDRGYRGYTLIKNFREGAWRCSVETKRGQVLGRENFTVEQGERELVTRIE